MEKKHTGERSFCCESHHGCGKTFPEKWQLKRHQKKCAFEHHSHTYFTKQEICVSPDYSF